MKLFSIYFLKVSGTKENFTLSANRPTPLSLLRQRHCHPPRKKRRHFVLPLTKLEYEYAILLNKEVERRKAAEKTIDLLKTIEKNRQKLEMLTKSILEQNTELGIERHVEFVMFINNATARKSHARNIRGKIEAIQDKESERRRRLDSLLLLNSTQL